MDFLHKRTSSTSPVSCEVGGTSKTNSYPSLEHFWYKMTEKTAPWWRSFVGKRRKAARESASMLEQELAAHATSGTATTNISTQKESTTEPEWQNVQLPQQQADGGTSLLSDETYDDSAVQPTFSEGTSRRNLRVSRSGRFKEKRHMRVGLPSNYQDSPNTEGKGGAQAPR